MAQSLMPTAAFSVKNYNLDATLASGQAFRWKKANTGQWEGVVGGRWVRLTALTEGISAETTSPVVNWSWLEHFLQLHVDLPSILATFPSDEPMEAAISSCPGLRLLRQDPWETLASFICSSNKQIVQIQQVMGLLCARFGEKLPVPEGCEAVYSFPSAERLAASSEGELRDCKMGFRAPYLLGTAQKVASGEVDLTGIYKMSLSEAREELMRCPGVGPKIADCVLLFGFGFQEAFPIDVWIMKVVRELYFPRRKIKPARLRHFTATHFGSNAGYAQQYLFHYARTVWERD